MKHCYALGSATLSLFWLIACTGKSNPEPPSQGTGGTANGGSQTAGGTPSSGGKTNTGGVAGATTGTGGGTATALDPCRGTKAPGSVAEGLCAVQIGSVTGARQITFSSNGDLWVASANGVIRRLRDANGNGTYESTEIVQWANTGGNGQNVHIDEEGGFLYSGTKAGVRRWPWSLTAESGGDGEDVLTGQPGNGNHPKHTVHVWDGNMYVMSGSSGNVSHEGSDKSSYDEQRSLIKRFRLADFKAGTPLTWASGEIFAKGLRNTLGFARDAKGRMYGVQNGQDDVRYKGESVVKDNPGEVLMRLEMGTAHGYPYCFVAQQISGVAPGLQVASEIFNGNTRDDDWCRENAAAPVTFLQAHSAPMEILFFTQDSTALPARWKNGAFVSLHGSWNRNPGSGKKVVWVPFNEDGTSPQPVVSGNTTTFPYEVVYGENLNKVDSGQPQMSDGGFRPVGLAISPLDGALYISSDGDGRLYRVGSQE